MKLQKPDIIIDVVCMHFTLNFHLICLFSHWTTFNRYAKSYQLHMNFY